MSRGHQFGNLIGCLLMIVCFAGSNGSPVCAADDDGAAEDVSIDNTREIAQQSPTEPITPNSPPNAPAQPSPKSILLEDYPFRFVGFFQSQLAELVPEGFTPVKIDRFLEALKEFNRAGEDRKTVRMVSATYNARLVGNVLVSDRSDLQIQVERSGDGRCELNPCNLLLEPLMAPTVQENPYTFATTATGRLALLASGKRGETATVPFAWRLYGTPDNLGHTFDIRIPRTPRTRFVINVPQGIEIEAIDGIARKTEFAISENPPASSGDSSQLSNNSTQRNQSDQDEEDARPNTYEIDAGGLSRIRLRTINQRISEQSSALIIRRSRMEYNLEPSGMFWIHRMVVSIPATETWPEIEVANSKITSVKVNAAEATFETVPVPSVAHNGKEVKLRRVTITPPPGAVNRLDSFASITVMGQTDWDSTTALPIPRWVGTKVIDASIQVDVQLAIASPMSLIRWDLPSTWSEYSVGQIDGFELHQALGQFPISDAPGAKSNETLTLHGHRTLWSSIQVADEAIYQASDLSLNLEANESSVSAKALLDITVNEGRIEPLELLIQEGWDLEQISFKHSARTVDSLSTNEARSPSGNGVTRSITLWPDASDLRLVDVDPKQVAEDDGQPAENPEEDADGQPLENPLEKNDQSPSQRWSLAIEVNASRPLEAKRGVVMMPETWFLRTTTDDKSMTVFFSPPEGMNWSDERSGKMQSVMRDTLDATKQTFFAETNRSGQIYQPLSTTVGPLQMESPDVSFAADIRFEVHREGSEWIEKVRVKLQAAESNLEELRILTGPANERSEFQWAVTESGRSASYSLSAADVQWVNPSTEGLYILDVSQIDLRNASIVGKRRYPGDLLKTKLPHIVGAASVSAEVLIAKGIQVKQKDVTVQAVPLSPTLLNDALLSDSPESHPVTSQNFDKHFRYESAQQPTVVLQMRNTEPEVNLITQANVRMVASSRGSDRVEAIYRAEISKPLVIGYDPTLELVSITRNSEEISIAGIPQRPIVIAPLKLIHPVDPSADEVFRPITSRPKPEILRIVWQRNRFQSNVVRKVRIPQIAPEAIVMHQEYRLMASPDSFLPFELIGMRQSQRTSSIEMNAARGLGVEVSPNQEIRIVRRNITLACGWLIAIFMYAAGWYVMRRSPLLVAAAVILFATVAVQWWHWRLPISGWLITPLVVAGMMVAARAWKAKDRTSALTDQLSTDHLDPQNTAHAFDPPDDPSLSFFGTSLFRVLIFAFAFAAATCVGHAGTIAQESPSINVLVPADADGRQVGDVVYIPNKFKSQLFQTTSKRQRQRPLIQSAKYRLKIPDPLVARTEFREALIEVDFTLLLPNGLPSLNEVILPIASQNIRRMEWIGENNRIIRFSSNEDGETLATLPGGRTSRLRVTMVPQYDNRDQWDRYTLPIPKVFDSSLSVEADGDIRVLRVGGANGRLMTETDLRRWVQPIGPMDRLQIDFRAASGSPVTVNGNPTRLQRRYWISAGWQQITIDCEVDPSIAIAAGETFSFVIRDNSIPEITSPNWRLIETELYSPSRRSMTVESIKDNPGPVQLLWTRPLDRSRGDQPVWFRAFDIPEVIASSLGENAPAWIAFHANAPLQWDPILESVEPLSVDSFLAGWAGYRGRIQRSIVAMNEIPTPVLREVPQSRGVVEGYHNLHVTDGKWELDYFASLRPSSEQPRRYTLDVPANANIMDLRVNNRKIRTAGITTGDRRMIRLGDFKRDDIVQISLRATRRLGRRQRFVPPVISVTPATQPALEYPKTIQSARAFIDGEFREAISSRRPLIRSDAYSVSRDRSCNVRIIKPFDIKVTQSRATLDAETLLRGRLPVSTWTTSDAIHESVDHQPENLAPENLTPGNRRTRSGSSPWGGLFTAEPQRRRADTQQVISLMREEGRWAFSLDLQVDSSSPPEYVDVEIPQRWSDELTVSPKVTWGTKTKSENQNTIVLRIQYDQEQFANQPLRIQGKLEMRADGNISVPPIRVLDRGRHTVFARTPNRLANEQLQWRENGVGKSQLPDWFDPPDNQSESFATYRILARSWSIDLAPLPKTDLNSIASIQDNQVFIRNDSILVLSHWDLAPGNRSSLVLKLPPQAKTLAAWCSGKPIEIQHSKSPQAADGKPDHSSDDGLQQIKLPLVVSRLPQTVRLMIELPLDAVRSSSNYLPQPVDAPINEIWLMTYQAPRDSSQNSLSASEIVLLDTQRQLRLLSLARSTVESVESAVGLLVDRPSDEVAQWLSRWVERYQTLAMTANQDIQLAPGKAQGIQIDEISGSQQWQLLDERLAVYTRRYLTNSPSATNTNTLVSVDPFAVFDVVSVENIGSVASAPRLSINTISDHWIGPLVTRSLRLLLVIFIFVCARSIQQWLMPLAVHPATWMTMLALLGFIIAPPYVAAALLLVAICLSAFPSQQKRWEWSFPRR